MGICGFVFFFFFFTFNWKIIALQCCVGFCHTTMWISCKYTCILSLILCPILPPPPPSHPSRSSQSTVLSFLYYTAASLWISAHTRQCICQCYSLSSSPFSIPLCVHKSGLYTCVSPPAWQIDSSVPFFQYYTHTHTQTYIYTHTSMIFVLTLDLEKAGLPRWH